ncbi:MAG: response regulator, partial [Bacteroidales bacterium]|nr:response regulator [Bacteroidales bacterium]
RTPLTLIIGGIDDISKATPKGDKNEYAVSLVQKNANRMMMLVNELLDIRAVVKGKIRLKVSPIDIVQLLRQVYDNFKDMAAERHMEMRLTHSVDKLVIWGDAMRLEALIYNLFSNAYKYTADGGLIEAAIFYREGDPDFTIMVKDNGVGVPKDKQTSIFEPFVRAADTVYKGLSSSGIGLSFSKEIVDMHGGRIWVESEKGEGSKFFVRLPIDRDHFSEEVAEFIDDDSIEVDDDIRGLSQYRVEPTYPEGAVKVLVVEDNAELRVYLYNNLVSRYEVRDAANGVEALQVLATDWIPDIIVTDYMMPEMDGIELINHIRNDVNTSHLPIIMFTAKHETDTHIKAMKYGADGYIAKPFTMELFIARIENVLERRHQLVRLMASRPGAEKESAKVKLTPEEVVITDRDEDLIKRVQTWLEDNIADSEITVDMLATYVGMGRTSLYNKIKGLTGKSPVELIQEFRMEKATYYLKLGQLSVSEISYKVGFSDPGYFSRTFKKHFGVSPSDYIKGKQTDSNI